MRQKEKNKKRPDQSKAIFTPGSKATVLINYSNTLKILEVAFTNGKVYHYLNVPSSIWSEYRDEIESGKSSGEFVNTRIKPVYEFIEIIS